MSHTSARQYFVLQIANRNLFLPTSPLHILPLHFQLPFLSYCPRIFLAASEAILISFVAFNTHNNYKLVNGIICSIAMPLLDKLHDSLNDNLNHDIMQIRWHFKIWNWGWRECSVIDSVPCSFRGPESDFQHPHQLISNLCNFSFRALETIFWLSFTPAHLFTYTQKHIPKKCNMIFKLWKCKL